MNNYFFIFILLTFFVCVYFIYSFSFQCLRVEIKNWRLSNTLPTDNQHDREHQTLLKSISSHRLIRGKLFPDRYFDSYITCITKKCDDFLIN